MGRGVNSANTGYVYVFVTLTSWLVVNMEVDIIQARYGLVSLHSIVYITVVNRVDNARLCSMSDMYLYQMGGSVLAILFG